jgi:dienelactone hydrolase
LYVPTNWNGDAVLIAHGYKAPTLPVAITDESNMYAMRDLLGAQGFAVAYSSYSINGFAVKDGAQRTHQLRGLLASHLAGAPARTYLLGYSLGGGIVVSLAEQYPTQYAGALSVCGMNGGSRLQTQYLGHVRALADVFFPGKLPGNVEGVPSDFTFNDPAQIGPVIQSNPLGLFVIASTKETPLPWINTGGDFTNPQSLEFRTLAGSLFGALSFHARGINDITDIVHTENIFDNSTTTYAQGTLVNPQLAGAVSAYLGLANATVKRYSIAPQAEQYLARHFTPSGRLDIPLLTLHNRWDPAVPNFHNDTLAARVLAAGSAANLKQEIVNDYGHCNVAPARTNESFGRLRQWAEAQ